jgi:hypothetical protein
MKDVAKRAFRVVFGLAVVATAGTADAKDNWFDKTAQGIGRFLGGMGNAYGKRALKGTRLDPDKDKPIQLKKPLRECMKENNQIDDEVIECMKDE